MEYKESDGGSLRSVASLCLEILNGQWRFMKTEFHKNLENHEIQNFRRSPAKLKADFAARSRAMLKVSRIAYKF